MGIIYKLTCKTTQKVYIGQTIQPLERRLSLHRNQSLRNDVAPIHRAIKKYGWDDFIVETIDQSETKEDLDSKEEFWIKELNCIRPGGYNVLKGSPIKGFSHGKRSKETVEKLSKSHIGHRISEETKKKISETKKKNYKDSAFYKINEEKKREKQRRDKE